MFLKMDSTLHRRTRVGLRIPLSFRPFALPAYACIELRHRSTMCRSCPPGLDHRDLDRGLIRLHLLYNAGVKPLYGHWMIKTVELAGVRDRTGNNLHATESCCWRRRICHDRQDHIFFLADARSENECQRDEVFRRSSVKVADLAAFKVGPTKLSTDGNEAFVAISKTWVEKRAQRF